MLVHFESGSFKIVSQGSRKLLTISNLLTILLVLVAALVDQYLGFGLEFCGQSSSEGEHVILNGQVSLMRPRSHSFGGHQSGGQRLKRSAPDEIKRGELGILQQLSRFLGAYQAGGTQRDSSNEGHHMSETNLMSAQLEGPGAYDGAFEPVQPRNSHPDDRQQSATSRQRITPTISTTGEDDQATLQAQPPTMKVIETAVFIDQALDNKFTGLSNGLVELNKLVLTIMNQVQYLFEYSSLQVSIKLKLVLVEHLKESERLTGMPAPNPERGDIDAYLSNFCNWQQSRLQSEKRLWWDHAILLSGLDLYKATPGKNHSGVLGLAWVGGMCKGNYSCTINEASNFESAFVIAHEIGHSLGIMHDGQKNKCDPNTFIMSERTGAGKVHWSKCSNAYLNESIQRGQLRCLDSEQNNQIDSLYDLTKLRAPGQVYAINEQCRLAFGNNYSSFVAQQQPFNAVCRELWCVSGTWAKAAHPALEGSLCGQHELVCREGKCIKVVQ